ncbi:MAG TPA: hypothetical protein VEA63_12765 [Opitutus sp.]|nr:hypothetical protein [Opitutus sp.]
MKPSMSDKALQTAIVVFGAMIVGLAEAPGIEALIPQPWLHIVQLVAAAVGASQLIKRRGDYAPSEVTLVERKSVT